MKKPVIWVNSRAQARYLVSTSVWTTPEGIRADVRSHRTQKRTVLQAAAEVPADTLQLRTPANQNLAAEVVQVLVTRTLRSRAGAAMDQDPTSRQSHTSRRTETTTEAFHTDKLQIGRASCRERV